MITIKKKVTIEVPIDEASLEDLKNEAMITSSAREMSFTMTHSSGCGKYDKSVFRIEFNINGRISEKEFERVRDAYIHIIEVYNLLN